MASATKPKLRVLAIILIWLSAVFAPGPVAADTLNLLAAASATDIMQAAAKLFEQQTPHRIRLTTAGSSTLARQIEAGAPAHVFLSASREWMDRLDDRGLLANGTRIDLLANKLVVIARRPTKPLDLVETSILRRLRDGRMVMGDPAHVPAGRYARDALMAMGFWPGLRRRMAFTAHVREVVVLVGRGEAPLGVSYLTDALASDRVDVVATFAEQSHGPIIYPLAVIDAQDGAPARALHGFLAGAKVRAIYLKYGFQVRS